MGLAEHGRVPFEPLGESRMNTELEKRFSNRREMLRWLGLTAVGAIAGPMVRPLRVEGQRNVNPLGTARNAIMVKLSGAQCPADTWDFKETRYTPADLQPRMISADLQLSETLYPRLVKSNVLQRISFLRSMHCLLYTSPSPRDRQKSRMPSSA